MKARYIQRGESIDFIPQTDTEAGAVVFLGKLAGITKLDIPAGELGAVATVGVFNVVKASGAIAQGAAIYWDADAGKATTTPNAKYLGVAIEAAASDAEAVKVLINVGAGDYEEESDSSSSSASASASNGGSSGSNGSN
jgi:predicted RecA/RadA family phage recombinase